LSMKWGPPSLMTIRGVPKHGNITSWNIFLECLESAAQHGNASTHLDTVHSHQDVFDIFRLWEWSHEVDGPYIEQLHLEVVHEWHYISSINVSMFLASNASSDKLLCILVYHWPEESTLPNLSMRMECSIMSSIRWCMTPLDDFHGFSHRDTSL
jgi:hypothetical protein